MKFTSALMATAVSCGIALSAFSAWAGSGFSNRSINGTYASTFQGSVIDGDSLLPINGTAVIAADGKGGVTGVESFVFDGTICTGVTSKGNYSVNPDGSGTASFIFKGSTSACSGSYTQSFAIADSGRLVVLNNTNANNQISETWRAQSGFPF